MIVADTTLLIDLWRGRKGGSSSAQTLLQANPGQDFVVPAHAAGEFLEGASAVGGDRLAQSLQFLRFFRVGTVDLEVALEYAKIVGALRLAGDLGGKSKPDCWIAAWARAHASPLATRNVKHFQVIDGLEILAYDLV